MAIDLCDGVWRENREMSSGKSGNGVMTKRTWLGGTGTAAGLYNREENASAVSLDESVRAGLSVFDLRLLCFVKEWIGCGLGVCGESSRVTFTTGLPSYGERGMLGS